MDLGRIIQFFSILEISCSDEIKITDKKQFLNFTDKKQVATSFTNKNFSGILEFTLKRKLFRFIGGAGGKPYQAVKNGKMLLLRRW